MGLREWWARLTGGEDADRLEREEDSIRNRREGEPPAELEDYEGIKDDTTTREYELPGDEAAAEDEAAR